jgi:hypothetical protein
MAGAPELFILQSCSSMTIDRALLETLPDLAALLSYTT